MDGAQQEADQEWRVPFLQGRVAVVTGGSRGAGRGIARVLGQCGATVYVTARSDRRRAAGDRSETIEDTAAEVDTAGGHGIPVRTDHTVPQDVERLFARVADEAGRLDLLVNNAWGGYEKMVDMRPFWEIPIDHWDLMFHGGLRTQFLTTRHAVPLLQATPGALVVHTTSPVGDDHHGHVAYDVSKRAVTHLTRGMAADLNPHDVAVVAVAPGWMRTERVLEAFGAGADEWVHRPELVETESVAYVGRGIAHLARDPERARWTGRLVEAGTLAGAYGFTDVDGRILTPFTERLPRLLAAMDQEQGTEPETERRQERDPGEG